MYFSDEEIEKFRADTPGCLHKIHLNNAGASLMPAVVTEAIVRHIELESTIGGYEAGDKKSAEIAQFYNSAAQLLKCNPSEIAFTTNATDSFSRAISSIPFKAGDIILTTNEDYISNQITYLALKKRFGTRLIRAASLSTGGVDIQDFERCIVKYKPRLVAVTHIPTNSGLVQPVCEIGSLCEKYEILYLLDACQSVGQLPLDVKQLKCDFLSATSRKFLRGPRGAGFLYVAEKTLKQGYEPLFIDMRGADWVSDNKYVPKKDATRFENWEFAYALLLGTGAAIDYCLQIDITKIEAQVKYLANYIRTWLQKITGITLHDKGPDPAGLVTFHLKGSDPEFIKNFLSKKNINVVTSYRNFAVIDYDEKKVEWTIRVSPHYFNTIHEADLFLDAMHEIKRGS